MLQRFQGQFPLRYMKHGSSWSVFMSAASYCIWQVEISYPLPCPGTQSINITLQFYCVFFILNFTIANTVISKKSYFRLNIWWDVIYLQREQQGTKNGALGTPDKTGAQSDFTPFTTTRCCLKQRKESIHFNVLPPIPQLNNLFLRSSWGGVSNAFSKSNMNVSTCPLLSKILAQLFITVVNWVSQLCPFLNACCLSDRSLCSSRWAMIFEHTMCSSNLQGTQVKETGR